MKYIIKTLSLLCVACCGMCSAVAGNAYDLVWEDDFTGTTLNESQHWNVEVNGDGGGNRELQYYSRENVSVGLDPESGASCLILTARKCEMNGKNATSGRVNTRNKVCAAHGKIEARIKFPRTADGLWPAFWLLGNDYSSVGWPRCGEIDVVEMGHADGIKNATQDRYFNGACHWGVSHTDVKHFVQNATAEYDLQDGDFHLFTIEWDEHSIKMYLDRDRNPEVAPYFVAPIGDRSKPDSPGHFFHKPFFILFNLAVGGEFTGIEQIEDVTALAGGEAKMYIDYVRVYRRGGEAQPANEMTYQK